MLATGQTCPTFCVPMTDSKTIEYMIIDYRMYDPAKDCIFLQILQCSSSVLHSWFLLGVLLVSMCISFNHSHLWLTQSYAECVRYLDMSSGQQGVDPALWVWDSKQVTHTDTGSSPHMAHVWTSAGVDWLIAFLTYHTLPLLFVKSYTNQILKE